MKAETTDRIRTLRVDRLANVGVRPVVLDRLINV